MPIVTELSYAIEKLYTLLFYRISMQKFVKVKAKMK